MSLTVGTAPFGQRPGGTFNFERPRTKGVIWFEDSPRRIRARLGGETVVDSRHAKLLHEHAHLPIYYFPQEEVRMDLLVPCDKHTTCPYKGEASYWSVHAGGKVAEDAVWSYPEPIEDAPPLAGYMAFYWHKMDEWLEEDEPAIVHARDPYHRIDILDTSRHVRVRVNGEQVADTTRGRVLFETVCRRAGTCPARTSAWTSWKQATPAPAAPTRATRPTGPSATSRTSCGRTPSRRARRSG